MIYGIGVDLVDVQRMDRVLGSPWAARFVSRVFSAEEISACEQSARPAERYAARFAAKEAVVKALGTGFSGGIAPGMVTVIGGERNKPAVRLIGKAQELFDKLSLTAIHVSLTHTSGAACAFAVAESDVPVEAPKN